MMKNAYRSMDEVEPEHRQFYVERGGLVVIMDGLDDLLKQYNDIEAAHVAAMADSDKRLADAKAELTSVRRKQATRHAMQAAGVPPKWHDAVAALVQEQEQEGVPLETTVRRFLDSDEGEPYRGRQEAQPHFTARLRGRH